MADPTRDSTQTHAAVIASAVRDALIESPDIQGVEDVEWNRGPSLEYEIRRAIVHALKPDLYIAPGERDHILNLAKQNPVLVEAVLNELRNDQPLFSRVESLQQFLKKPSCNWKNFFSDCIFASQRGELQTEIRNRLKPALQKAIQDPNSVVSEKAQELLDQLDDRPKYKAVTPSCP